MCVPGLAALLLVAGCATGPVRPTASPVPTSSATETEPIESGASLSLPPLIDALRDGRVVALGEWHGRSDEHRFFTEVLREPNVRSILDSVVVEFGAAPEQDVVDRYVAGDDVPHTELRKIWTTTTQQSGVWDAPVYRQFFETVRALNSEGGGRKLHVILGDPGQGAVLCGQPDGASDAPCVERDAFMADRAADELSDGHRVLIVAGVFHVWRPIDDRSLTVTQRLEAMGWRSYVLLPFGGPMLNNASIRSHLSSKGSLVVTAEWLTSVPASIMRGTATVTCDHPPCETPGDVGSLRDVADGFLDLGP
jgi:hypothetical protein